MTVQAGTRLGPYSILGSLGAGGMGEVYRARDTTLNRDVAIKVLPELFSRDPDRRARFEREAQAVAALSHPNVLAIYEFGTSGETSYAAMELLDGETLRDRIDRGPQAARRAVDICAQIARGLAAAHEKGIVHRDVKPENVFVTREGRVKILDFGLASQRVPSGISADLTMPPTDAGTVLGTVGYMAPEQVRGLPADARSDIFALGATLYELVSGRGAFHRESAAETMSAIAREDPAPMSSTAAAAISPTVERIIWRCLEKDPAARFQSCHDLAFALENASVDSGTASAGGVTVPSWRSRWWPAAAWIAVGGIAGAALAGLAFKPDPVGVSSGPVATYDIQMPARTQLQRVEGHPIVAASPDGSAVVFVGVSRGVSRLYSRRSRDAEAHPIAGTEGAEIPSSRRTAARLPSSRTPI